MRVLVLTGSLLLGRRVASAIADLNGVVAEQVGVPVTSPHEFGMNVHADDAVVLSGETIALARSWVGDSRPKLVGLVSEEGDAVDESFPWCSFDAVLERDDPDAWLRSAFQELGRGRGWISPALAVHVLSAATAGADLRADGRHGGHHQVDLTEREHEIIAASQVSCREAAIANWPRCSTSRSALSSSTSGASSTRPAVAAGLSSWLSCTETSDSWKVPRLCRLAIRSGDYCPFDR